MVCKARATMQSPCHSATAQSVNNTKIFLLWGLRYVVLWAIIYTVAMQPLHSNQRKGAIMATATAKQSTTKQANTRAKQGQQAKQAAPVQQTRQYPTVPSGYGCHGMYNAQGQLNSKGHVPAAQAIYATPRKLGLTPSVGIPSGNTPVTLCPQQPSIGAKYASAYAAVAAGFKAAQAAHGNNVTAAQVQAHMPAWPANKPKAGSAWRHVVRTLGIAWQATA